jgi:opacity protein-like surface antigen
MRSFSLVAGAVLVCAGVLSAQEESTPKFEVGVTYSGVHLDAANNSGQRTGNGGSGSFEYNVNKYLGVVADFGGYANTRTGIDDKFITYMFGPRLNLRHNRLNPYVQSLFGGGYAWSGPSNNNQNAFVYAIGGGLDYGLTRHIAIKPVQVEYLRTAFDSTKLGDSTSTFGDHQNGVRYSAGIVFRFGEK